MKSASRLDLFDRRLRLNLAVFMDDYDPRVVLVDRHPVQLPSNPDPGPVFRGLTGGTCPAGTGRQLGGHDRLALVRL